MSHRLVKLNPPAFNAALAESFHWSRTLALMELKVVPNQLSFFCAFLGTCPSSEMESLTASHGSPCMDQVGRQCHVALGAKYAIYIYIYTHSISTHYRTR